MDLPFDGDAACFRELVKSYSGDAPARAVLDELLRVGDRRADTGRQDPPRRAFVHPENRRNRKDRHPRRRHVGPDRDDRPQYPSNGRSVLPEEGLLRQPPFRGASRVQEPRGEPCAGTAGTSGPVAERAGPGLPSRGRRDGQDAGRGRDLLFPGGLRRGGQDMIPAGRIPRLRTGIPVLLLAFLSFSCGIGGSDFAGGGTGGTGISTGAISGFGSVVVNGVHFRTDNNVAPGFLTKKMVNGADKSPQSGQGRFLRGDGRDGSARDRRQQRPGDRVPGQPPGAHCRNRLRGGQHHRGPRPDRRRGECGDLPLPQAGRHRGGQRVRG